MKQTKFFPSITVLLLLSCGLLAPAATVPASTQPAVMEPTTIPTEAMVVTQPPTVEQVPPTSENHFGLIARYHLEALTAIGARSPGSPEELEASQYITETFTKLGYTPKTQKFNAWDEDNAEYTSQNVIAVKQGDSPKEIIIGAHYDSGTEALGVDDNGSGVAILLETAEQIAKLQTPYSIRFIALGSEENNLDGSSYYAELMTAAEVQNTITYINLDSLAAGDFTYIYSDEGQKAFLRDWVLTWAGENGVPLQTIQNVDLTDGGEYVADYGAFVDRGIPYIYFEATNWTVGTLDGWTQVEPQYGDEGYIWHTQYDTLEYLDATFPGRVNEHLKIFVSALVAICTEYQ
jgi:alkaline phosphatase isozyme conversion protein